MIKQCRAIWLGKLIIKRLNLLNHDLLWAESCSEIRTEMNFLSSLSAASSASDPSGALQSSWSRRQAAASAAASKLTLRYSHTDAETLRNSDKSSVFDSQLIVRWMPRLSQGFSPLIPFTQLPKDLLYEITCAIFEPITGQLSEYLNAQPIGALGSCGWACPPGAHYDKGSRAQLGWGWTPRHPAFSLLLLLKYCNVHVEWLL